jgi:hypothetical protein
MKPSEYEEGHRWKSLPGWEWMPGMLAQWKPEGGAGGQQVFPTAVRLAELSQPVGGIMAGVVDVRDAPERGVPVPSDPATFGCLDQLTRQITRDERGYLSLGRLSWIYYWEADGYIMVATGSTRTLAMLAACEAS